MLADLPAELATEADDSTTAAASRPSPDRAEEPVVEEPVVEDAPVVEEPVVEEPVVEEPVPAAEDRSDAVTATDDSPAGDASGSADDVFARLRAEQPSDEADDATDEVDPEAGAAAVTEPDAVVEPSPAAEAAVAAGVDTAFTARASAVEPVDKELGRRLKRALADEQNEVLDLLRRAKPKGVDDLLPGADEHAVALGRGGGAPRWRTQPQRAAPGGAPASIADLADELARVAHRAAARAHRAELRGVRRQPRRRRRPCSGPLPGVEGQALDGGRGALRCRRLRAGHLRRDRAGRAGALGASTRALEPVPDCDDNVLAGAIAKGDEFPTGNPCAPAHPGCHCLVLLAAD